MYSVDVCKVHRKIRDHKLKNIVKVYRVVYLRLFGFVKSSFGFDYRFLFLKN